MRWYREDSTSDAVYTIKYSYYTTAEEEAELTVLFDQVFSEVVPVNGDDYQKVKAIYNYITTHVTYDRASLNNNSYEKKFTAYAALVNKTAVCQGYSALFYRFALPVTQEVAGSSPATVATWLLRQNG